MFVIAGVTGNTGSVVADTLLSQGKKVRVIVRDASKGEAWKKRGAEVAVAELEDADALAAALAGAAGAYLLLPPRNSAPDVVAEQKRVADSIAKAVAKAKVPHVVLLSSIGAQHAAGTGPILSVRNAEQQLRASGLPATFVRAAYFVENWGAVVPAVESDGVLPSFIAARARISMVSTPDIGKTVAQSLIEGPRGVRVIELSGPSDASPNDVAAAFSRILGKPVQVLEAPLEAVVPTFTSLGISGNVAELFREMYEALAAGKLSPEPGEQVRGTTQLESTLRGLLG